MPVRPRQEEKGSALPRGTDNAADDCALLQQPLMLDADDVARLLKCSPRTVYRLADSGRMPGPIRLGRLMRWSRQALEQWIADGCPSCKHRR